ncbi:GerAB/ArcD/ProY family transporter [Metabacillus bambusae]|uniref:Endospore germination permease n=1 Tax=Metabacillus bambusae TaxID=2795218 RepID=A0ABS3N9U9_9BACI|nr:endospore germination permease [Metabacillus bambusae]MBO1515061.1 endospore germination permease [Metabacillus bambusae]
MEQQKISGLQIFYVLVGFEFGTAIILGVGAGAKQDAWLAIMISMLSSLILMGVFTQLSLFYPNDTLVSMLPKIIGKYLSYPVMIIYIFHFIYSAARACRDFGELITSTILVQTPVLVVIGSFMLLIIYCLRGGVETLGRMGEMVFPIYFISMIVIWILLLSMEDFNFKNLSPVMGNGVKPILKETFPGIINFPFGESIIIMMFFPFLKNKRIIRKVGMSVILVGGLLLTLNSIFVLSVLGPEIYGKDWFPFLTATRMVSIADFLERFDALIILMMVAGVFFKVGGWTFGAVIGISQLLKLNQTKSVVLALGTIITPLSLLIATDFGEHLEIGLDYFVPYFHVPLQIIFPILLLGIAFIRKKFNFDNSST